MLIQQVLLLMWLCASYGVVFAIGGALLESGRPWWALAFLLLVPAWRLWRRFEGKGYYLMGYIGDVGGDRWETSRWVTPRSNRTHFQFCLLTEIGVVALLLAAVVLRQ